MHKRKYDSNLTESEEQSQKWLKMLVNFRPNQRIDVMSTPFQNPSTSIFLLFLLGHLSFCENVKKRGGQRHTLTLEHRQKPVFFYLSNRDYYSSRFDENEMVFRCFRLCAVKFESENRFSWTAILFSLYFASHYTGRNKEF